uniref:Uncharacterized protein n=1 Tax=Arundo donax TaxID=35708 RepID=A0A0A9ELJ4_ARUDO
MPGPIFQVVISKPIFIFLRRSKPILFCCSLSIFPMDVVFFSFQNISYVRPTHQPLFEHL